MQPDIRKWFMKQHGKGNDGEKTAKPVKPSLAIPGKPSATNDTSLPVKSVQGGEESSGRKKSSKYFAADKQNTAKRKVLKGDGEPSADVKPLSGNNDDDDDFRSPISRKGSTETTPNKKLKSGSGRGIPQNIASVEESDDKDDICSPTPKSAGRGRGRGGSVRGRGLNLESNEGNADDEDTEDVKSGGRGRGVRGGSTGSGRGGRGGGRGGFMNFGERKDPPHKGEKEIPEGAPDCLAGLTFVISGTLDSLEREEAEDLIKRYGGRITGSVSKKTNYLLCDEDIGGRKSSKAKELGTGFLTEDGLFDMIRASNRSKATTKENTKNSMDKIATSLPKGSPQRGGKKKDEVNEFPEKVIATPTKRMSASTPLAKQKKQTAKVSSLPWTEKYRPKVPNDIIGNQSLVKQLHDWLAQWNENFMKNSGKRNGKKQSDSGAKKAVLLSGTPGIGKTTSAKVVCQMLGFQTIEVNASDSRGKANANIDKGVGGSTANSIKELVGNESLSVNMDSSKHPKAVLIMDEVDGMSAGDRGGVADLISNIKMSKIPIICICNDRYSQKLKSLVNYCLLLSFRKPTKQQMGKRLMQIANAEGVKVNEVALEELAERVNGDMRMALNQLQYMSLSMSVIKYDDIRQRLLSSSKDEDISPFSAVDKLFGYNAAKLRMDERIDLSMSDPDLVPLIVQENYINYKPSVAAKDDNGIKSMNLIAQAADSIANGDIINVQIRRHRQWQLSQSSCLASSIIPAALLRGQRVTLEQGERNFNRFGGWLGKNSTMGKNYRLLEDMHVHLIASLQSNLGRTTLRIDYLSLLLKHLTDPLKMLPKEEAVEKVVEFMDAYSISQEDFDSLMDMSKFRGHPNPLDGVPPAVKTALTKAYNKGSKSRVIRTADLINLPGIKKAPKKRVAAMLEPADSDLVEENGDVLAENEENSSDTEDLEVTADDEEKPKVDLQSLNSKGIQVQMDLKVEGRAGTKRTASGRGRGGGVTANAPKRKR